MTSRPQGLCATSRWHESSWPGSPLGLPVGRRVRVPRGVIGRPAEAHRRLPCAVAQALLSLCWIPPPLEPCEGSASVQQQRDGVPALRSRPCPRPGCLPPHPSALPARTDVSLRPPFTALRLAVGLAPACSPPVLWGCGRACVRVSNTGQGLIGFLSQGKCPVAPGVGEQEPHVPARSQLLRKHRPSPSSPCHGFSSGGGGPLEFRGSRHPE